MFFISLRFIFLNNQLSKRGGSFLKNYHNNTQWKHKYLLKKHSILLYPISLQTLDFRFISNKKDDLTSLFVPIPIKSNPDDINIGAELADKLNKQDIMKILGKYYQLKEVRELCKEHGIDNTLFQQTYMSFRKFCLESEYLPVDLHIILSDILRNASNVNDLLPYFLKHSKQIFPHLECMEELKKISDLRNPANWYPEARAITRKIIYHAGPTNSGKTYHALQRFLNAKSGLYCGPLKLLAVEVHKKSNQMGTCCDLITGEERIIVNENGEPSSHVSCTVEMASVQNQYEVAIIDEIQMMRDQQRGWAWTRAFLGIAAEEIHICGEGTAIDLIKEICTTTGEHVEVRKYKRLTQLKVQNEGISHLKNVEPGDCIVCFSKNDIYTVSRQLEKLGNECAVIYGGLPPGTKLAQAEKFNNPDDLCKILVATDAIGMGLNLSIRRIIFYSLIKPVLNEKGEKEMNTISVSQALQIAGRAGRYGTQFSDGLVTTFKNEDLFILKEILSQQPETIEKGGLHPTADQIELYAYHLPHSTLSNLIDIFISLSTVDDSLYFMCNLEDFKFLADMIEHVPLPLRARYVFCCAPINRKLSFVCTMFLKFSRQYSKNESISFDWLCNHIGWPFLPPNKILDLVHLEGVFDVLDLYLWLSYRFADLFPDVTMVRDMQKELDHIIQLGVANITNLLKNSETKISSGESRIEDEDTFIMKTQQQPMKQNSNLNDVDQKQDEKILDKVVKDKSYNIGKGKLTERLLAQGLLTPKMLEELKKEWVSSEALPSSTSKKTSKSKKKSPNGSSLKNIQNKK